MFTRQNLQLPVVIILILFLSACAPQPGLPRGQTPIPTLIPATEPGSPLGATEQPVFTIQSYPARLPSSAAGEALYTTHCASCHGVDGNGVVPGARNFGDLDYMRGEAPAFFYAVVTEGRGEMPGFQDTLTSDERWDVVFYVWRFSTTGETIALGRQIYGANCSACHGETGVGEVLGASDFTDPRQVYDRAPRDFYLVVTQGLGSMPAWQGRLSQEERWAVIDYVRTFSYNPGLEGSVTSPPTSEPGETTCDPATLEQANPFAWDDAGAIAAGQAIYEQSCTMCHGPDGSGGSMPGVSDFTSANAQSSLRANGSLYLCVVAEGRGSMPGWKETLTNEQMWQVLTYIASLGK